MKQDSFIQICLSSPSLPSSPAVWDTFPSISLFCFCSLISRFSPRVGISAGGVTMSGKVAQQAGKAVQKAKAIDWDYLQKVVVSDSGKRELAALHRAYDDVAATINDKFSIKPTNINWDFYKQKLGPSIVNIFEQSVSTLEKDVPEYKDDVTADYQAKHQALMAKAAEQEEESKKKIVELDKEIARVQEQKGALGTMTVDEYFAKNPESKEKIDNEIRNQIWG